jgi:glycosyltransferase involved in cell wall biosynthesis
MISREAHQMPVQDAADSLPIKRIDKGSNMPKKILMVCYYYPPITDVGAKRSVAFSKYLSRFGWKPHVISVKNPDRNYCAVGDESPPEAVPTAYSYSIFSLSTLSGKINGFLSRAARLLGRQLKVNYFYQLFCFPDIFMGWIPLTVLKSARLIRRHAMDLIFVTCTPYSSALIGLLLKKITGRPLVVDFRDQRGIEDRALSLKKFPLTMRRRIEARFIDRVLRGADLFVVTSQEIRKRYETQFPEAAHKVVTIYNGFDPDFGGQDNPAPKFDKFTIIYTGDFYFYALESMVFFEALQILKNSHSVDVDAFQFLYYGDGYGQIEKCAARYGVSDLVSAHPRVPYADVLQQLRRSHLQLIRIVPPMISTKVFEGISLDVPFLAPIAPGEVQEIIHTYSPGSMVVTEESGAKVAEAIIEARRKYQTRQMPPNRVEEFLAFFSRENQTRRLKEAIEANIYGRCEYSTLQSR